MHSMAHRGDGQADRGPGPARSVPPRERGPRVQVSPGAGRKSGCVDRSAPPRFKSRRPTVGLDTPCKKCGRPIYYNYKGPVEGLCGRCTDTTRKPPRFQRSRRIGFFEGRRSRGWITIVIVLSLAVVAVGAYLLYTLLS